MEADFDNTTKTHFPIIKYKGKDQRYKKKTNKQHKTNTNKNKNRKKN